MSFLDQSLAAWQGARTGLLNRVDALEFSENGPYAIKRMLAAVREHMGMEIAYISQFVSKSAYETVVFRSVDAPGFEKLLAVGDCKVRDDTYCYHVLNGNLPGLMTDTALYPRAQSLAVTHSMPIRAYIGVPIYLRDGSVYGMLCCSSPRTDPTLTSRDTQVMKVFADMVAQQLDRDLCIEKDLSEVSARIDRVIKRDEFKFAYQPILTLAPLRLEGVEALCRFSPEPYRPPDQWFGEAAQVGLGVELELAAVRMALRAFGAIPGNLFISVNVSRETALSGAFIEQFRDCPKNRLVLEITEHTKVDDYGALLAALAPLRAEGVRLSIDDAGAGFASLKHILNLNPDIVKLDIALTKAIDIDPARRAVGVLKVMAPAADAFSDEDVRVLALMSGLIAATMFHAAQYETNDLYIRATRDFLTGLPNRALFYDRLRQALFTAQRDASLLGILNLDLDRFKQINDELGHRAGDAALNEAGRRMSNVSRRSDTVARVGGDEFAVILPGLRSRTDAWLMSEQIEESVGKPFDFEGHQIDLKVSVGMSIYPDDGQDMTALLDLADRSMYAVKQARKRLRLA